MSTEQAIRHWSDFILDYLIEYSKSHQNFRFLPRKNNDRHGRLMGGHWFQGSHYINVSLVKRSGGNHSTKQIGFEVVLSDPENPSCRLILVHKGETEPAVLSFYADLKNQLRPHGLEDWQPSLSGLPYYGRVQEALATCLERDVPVIQHLIQTYKVEKWLEITKPSMQNKIDRILKIRHSFSSNDHRIARLCWNELGWIRPSGRFGKSASPNSYEQEKGYGHEEWLLDFDKLIDGYHYGFLQPISQGISSYIGRNFQVDLYSVNAVNKQKYWVGNIHDVEVLEEMESVRIVQEYDKRGWLREMQEQLQWLGITPENNNLNAGSSLFNVRFRPENYTSLDLMPFEAADEALITTPRYKFLKFREPRASEQHDEEEPPFRSSAPGDSDRDSTIRQFESKSIELPDTHWKIIKGLYAFLLPIYGKENIAYEYSSGMGNTRVDIAVRNGRDEIYYEVKSYHSIRHCIRVALGQLFEYCFFPNVQRAKKLVIVAQHEPDEEIAEYMQHLRDRLGIRLFYAWFDLEAGLLGEEV